MERRNALNISEVDSNLSHEETLQNFGLNVFKVHDGTSFCILKVAARYNPKLAGYIVRESEALKLARDVPGITHLVREYAPSNLHNGAILKEYFEGNELPKNAGSGIENIIRKTVCDLHSLGLVGLELAKKNTVLSLDKQDAKIIDLDSCDVYSECLKTITYDDFTEKKEEDMDDLEILFR